MTHMRLYTILFVLFGVVVSAKGNYLKSYLIESNDLTNENFLDKISFEEIFKLTLSNTTNYEEIEKLLIDHNRNIDAFFLQLAERKIEIDPTEINNKTNLLDYLDLGEFLIKHDSREFQIASDIILGTLAEKLNKGFKEGDLQKSDQEIMNIVEKLKAHQYGVSVPVSNMEKGIHHLKEGNLNYIWSRLWFDYPILCIIGILILLFVMYYIVKKIKKS